jgi:membrane-bound metal-dependent hydrolase YbcI (DUF457 family)
MAGLGHIGFGFAAKKLAPKAPLAVLLPASVAIDIVYIAIYLMGFGGEAAEYLSHSLLMSVVWTIIAGVAAFLLTRDARSAAAVGLAVFMHWVLDFLVWPMTAVFPDAVGMPLFFRDSPRVGLGLYRWPAVLAAGESGLLIGGILIYIFAKRAVRKTV